MRPHDGARTAALGTTALAVTAIPILLPRLRGTGEQTAQYDTAITPPDYAFAIWAPIFAGILINAGEALLPGRRRSSDQRSTGWPLSIAYGLNACWSIAAQTGRFGCTPLLLPAAVTATAVAHRRLQTATGAATIGTAAVISTRRRR